MRPAICLVVLTLAACGGTSAPAPEPASIQIICLAEFCISYPGDWDAETGPDFVTLTHSSDSSAMASVGMVDMRGIVEGAGGAWPAGTEETVEYFWDLLDDIGSASLSRLEALGDGSVRSEGSLEDGRLWHRLLPVDPPNAIGVEMRAPSRNWEAHAAIILAGVEPVP